MTDDGCRWVGLAEGNSGKRWVDGPSNVRLGIEQGESPVVIELNVPAGVTSAFLGATLPKLVDDPEWVQAILRGESPGYNPRTTSLLQTLAAIEDSVAADELALIPHVLALDKAICLKEIGAGADASQIVKQLPNVAIEVVELLHDAGVAAATEIATSLCTLIELASEWHGNPNLLEALRNDVADPQMVARDVLDAEVPSRDSLDLRPPAGFLAGERLNEGSPEDPDRIPMLGRQVVRLLRAASFIPYVDLKEFARGLIDRLRSEFDGQNVEWEGVIVEALKSHEKTEHQPAPLLAEIIAALLMTRTDIQGALERAINLDICGTSADSAVR